ncbi:MULTISPECIES: CaiB/BaiF CoA transferase family protein [Brevundimonas]|uniref:CaiB/BaiF CoA transferase family protein n=1 Tax=Brevundimonas naejangsanensis TaxID=588932 RepID=UPI00106BA9E4|nr:MULTISPECIES: CoA transferase [Brevundimonas]QBQ49580.1 CoA transferase [Brevundimonas naejangsanensis]
MTATEIAPPPLSGLRVLDLTRVVAGPFAAQTLGDLGADVIKVERKGEGDDVRRVGPPWMKNADGEDLEESTYFQSVNRNKRSIALDFSVPEGADALRRLAAISDILIENYRPGTLSRYGLGYEDLRAVNPRLIYCAVSGFGQDGPYAERSGYDYLIQGMGGVMSVTGPRDGEAGAGPVRVGIPLVDIFAGMNATIGILAALQHRHRTGQGQLVDISLFDSQLSSLLNTASAWLNAGTVLGRTGNDHPSAAPYGVYEASDGHVIIATFNDREFYRLADALGRPEWRTDSRFATNGGRVENRAAIKAAVGDIIRTQPRAWWVETLNAAKVSCGPINAMSDLEHDPHVEARSMIVALDHPSLGAVRTVASPLRLSRSPVAYRRAPPLMGEHTQEVLAGLLGLGPEAMAALSDKGAI